MAEYTYHHYVPAFLLRAWQRESDGSLTDFRWRRSGRNSYQLVAKPRHATAVGGEKHLYSFLSGGPTPNPHLEKTFFGPEHDDPAARVHKKILSGEALIASDLKIWSRFLVGLMVRTPWFIKDVRRRQEARILEDIGVTDTDLAHLSESQRNHVFTKTNDFLLSAIKRVIQQECWEKAFAECRWEFIDLSSSAFDLLISDSPVRRSGPFDGQYYVALPVSPRRLFLLTSHVHARQRLLSLGQREIARCCNVDSIANASEAVWATSESRHRPAVEKYLRRPVVL